MVAIDQTGSSLTPRQLQTIRTQAEELEGVFLNMLTKEMFASIKGDENFGGGFGEETWRSMQADELMGQMIALQEAANATLGLNQSNLVSRSGVYGK